ncbi:hypothetical protein MPC4_90031 [Methylocella tundrae]|uniref:Uncharacterized protein n=1 Tax=Methylocella tundrae TaxID=227605 RepID=A0A8B6MDE4_METTU|nr:hypothetical protein MPC4_90031 [Methylocella tundrae]
MSHFFLATASGEEIFAGAAGQLIHRKVFKVILIQIACIAEARVYFRTCLVQSIVASPNRGALIPSWARATS